MNIERTDGIPAQQVFGTHVSSGETEHTERCIVAAASHLIRIKCAELVSLLLSIQYLTQIMKCKLL